MFDQKSLFEAASLGVALDIFQSSKEGMFLIRKAKQEILSGMYELKDAEPTDCKLITSIQSRIRTAENFQAWISEGIMEGMQATQMLNDDDFIDDNYPENQE